MNTGRPPICVTIELLHSKFSATALVADAGLEPTSLGYEPKVLPLDESATVPVFSNTGRQVLRTNRRSRYAATDVPAGISPAFTRSASVGSAMACFVKGLRAFFVNAVVATTVTSAPVKG